MLLICSASSGENKRLASRLLQWARDMDIDAQTVDLTEVDLPLYTPVRDDLGAPPSVASLSATFAAAKGFFVCAPEYNGSIPPSLTNAIAWMSTQTDDFRALFNGKPLAMGTHSGGGGQKVLVAMRIQFSHLGCNVMGRELLTNKNKPLREESALSILRQLQKAMS